MKNAFIITQGDPDHEPELIEKYMTKLLEKEEFRVYNNFNFEDCDEIIKEKNIFILNKPIVPVDTDLANKLFELLHNGAGILIFHAALGNGKRNDIFYQQIAGGSFIFHPSNVEYTVNIDQNSSILSGVKDWTLTGEQYYCLVDPACTVHATSDFISADGRIIKMPVVWSKEVFNGKVFYFSVGHNLKEFKLAKDIFIRGCNWLAE